MHLITCCRCHVKTKASSSILTQFEGNPTSCSLSSIFSHHACSELRPETHTKNTKTPCPHSIFCVPTESHEVSESFSITVCIYRQQSQDPGPVCLCVGLCVCMCESVRVCVHGWVDECFHLTLPKTKALGPMSHLCYWTLRAR